MTGHVLVIDQGTTSTRSMIFGPDAALVAMAQEEFPQIFPQGGWVEHDPESLWRTALSTARQALSRAGVDPRALAGLGITNQRETTLVWSRTTGRPIHNAIVWQDRRTAEECRKLAGAGLEAELTRKTGLRLDPYFSATKVAWILDRVPGARAAAAAGRLAFGTIDSFLIWRLTGGRLHITDATNASRTALLDIRSVSWDDSLCEMFRVPAACLPEVRDSAGDLGNTDPAVLGEALPIRGIAGDQQAALVGQACFETGDVKSTYGTGAFLVLNTGATLVESQHRLLGTIAYRLDGRTTYALEGSVLSAGATIQWLRDGLGLVLRASEVEALAGSVADTGGVYLVPAFTGMGAPYWDPDARAAIIGITRATGRGEIARAGLDSVAYQTHDLIAAMAADGARTQVLKVDGGMAQNDLFLQRLADVLGVSILRPRITESTAFGAACLAGLGCGIYRSLADIARLWQPDVRCEPRLDAAARRLELQGWESAVRRARSG